MPSLASVVVTTSRAESFAPLPPHRYQRWMRYGQNATTFYPELLGLVMEDVRLDYCRLRLPWRTEISQVFGVAHGGAIASLVDSAIVPAIGAGYDDPVGFSTIELSVQFLNALRDEDAVAEGWITKRGGSIAFCEAEVRAATSGEVVARGLVTCKISRVKDRSEIRR